MGQHRDCDRPTGTRPAAEKKYCTVPVTVRRKLRPGGSGLTESPPSHSLGLAQAALASEEPEPRWTQRDPPAFGIGTAAAGPGPGTNLTAGPEPVTAVTGPALG